MKLSIKTVLHKISGKFVISENKEEAK